MKPEVRRPIDVLKSTLKAPSVEEQFRNALKENSGAFVASIIDLYNGDQYLQKCDPKEVVMEALKAATLKLPINKNLGFAWIVPYRSQGVQRPQFQMGYKGYIQLAMRTGQYRIINADIVYEGELQRVKKLTGEINFDGEKKSDKIEGYFAYIEMINGFSKTLYMSKEQIEAHAKKYSKSYAHSNSAWKTNFDEMAMKTVLRNLLSHYGFLSVEMMTAMDNDIKAESEVRDEEIMQHANKEEISVEDVEYEEQKPEQGETHFPEY